MPEFRVVDLIGQARAIERHVQSWPPDTVIAWLRRFGEVQYVPMEGGFKIHVFASPAGLKAAFWFTSDGRLAIAPLDH